MLSMKVIAISLLVQPRFVGADASTCTGSCDLQDQTSLLQVKQNVQPGPKRSDQPILLQAQQGVIPAMPMGAPLMPVMPSLPSDNMGPPMMPAMVPPLPADNGEKVVEGVPAAVDLSSAGATAGFYPYPGVGYNAGVAHQIYQHYGGGGYGTGYGGGGYGAGYPAAYAGVGGYGGNAPYGGYGGGGGYGAGYPVVPSVYAAMPYNSAPPVYGGYGQTMYPTYSSPIYNSGFPNGGYPYQSGSYGSPWASHTWFTEEGAKPTEVNIPRTAQP